MKWLIPLLMLSSVAIADIPIPPVEYHKSVDTCPSYDSNTGNISIECQQVKIQPKDVTLLNELNYIQEANDYRGFLSWAERTGIRDIIVIVISFILGMCFQRLRN